MIAGQLWVNRAKIRDGTFFKFSRESIISGLQVLLVGGGMLLVPYLALKNSEIRLKVSDACVEDIRNLDALEAGVLQGDSQIGNPSTDREISVCGGSADELSRRIALPSNAVSAILTAKVRSGTPNRAMRIYAVKSVVRDYVDIGDKRYGVKNVKIDDVERLVIQLESQGAGPKLANEALVRHSEEVKPGKIDAMQRRRPSTPLSNSSKSRLRRSSSGPPPTKNDFRPLSVGRDDHQPGPRLNFASLRTSHPSSWNFILNRVHHRRIGRRRENREKRARWREAL